MDIMTKQSCMPSCCRCVQKAHTIWSISVKAVHMVVWAMKPVGIDASLPNSTDRLEQTLHETNAPYVLGLTCKDMLESVTLHKSVALQEAGADL